MVDAVVQSPMRRTPSAAERLGRPRARSLVGARVRGGRRGRPTHDERSLRGPRRPGATSSSAVPSTDRWSWGRRSTDRHRAGRSCPAQVVELEVRRRTWARPVRSETAATRRSQRRRSARAVATGGPPCRMRQASRQATTEGAAAPAIGHLGVAPGEGGGGEAGRVDHREPAGDASPRWLGHAVDVRAATSALAALASAKPPSSSNQPGTRRPSSASHGASPAVPGPLGLPRSASASRALAVPAGRHAAGAAAQRTAMRSSVAPACDERGRTSRRDRP